MNQAVAQSELVNTSTIVVARRRGSPFRQMQWYLVVMGVAALTRVIWGMAIPVVPLSDSNAYDVFARNLAAGECYGWNPGEPTAFWAVGTSFMYSLLYRVFHPEQWGYAPVVVLNALIGVVTVGLAMLLARRWFSAKVAVATGLLLAFWPMHVQFTTVIASEQIFTALCLGGVLLWPETRTRIDWRRLILAGVIFGAAAYVRPTALLIPIVLAGAAALREQRIRDHVLRAGVATLLILVMLAPWSFRNYRQFGEVVLVSTNSGSNLWMGNNPSTSGEYMHLPPRLEGMNEASFDKYVGKQAKAYIMNEPGAFIARTIVKAVRLHERETIGISWNLEGLTRTVGERNVLVLKIAGQVYWMVVLGAALCGFVILAVRYRFRALMHPSMVIWMYFTAVHAVIVIQDRYHYPATPFIGCLAALALTAAWQPGRQKVDAEVESLEVAA